MTSPPEKAALYVMTGSGGEVDFPLESGMMD